MAGLPVSLLPGNIMDTNSCTRYSNPVMCSHNQHKIQKRIMRDEKWGETEWW